MLLRISAKKNLQNFLLKQVAALNQLGEQAIRAAARNKRPIVCCRGQMWPHTYVPTHGERVWMPGQPK